MNILELVTLDQSQAVPALTDLPAGPGEAHASAGRPADAVARRDDSPDASLCRDIAPPDAGAQREREPRLPGAYLGADPPPTEAVLRATLPPPAPCSCDGSIFWLDPYGGLHCNRCQPPKSASMVRGLARVRVDDDNAFVWAHERRTIPPDPGPLEFQSDDEPPCEKCGQKFFWWNVLDEKFCQNCEPKYLSRSLKLAAHAGRLREFYATDPETALRRAANQAKRAKSVDRVTDAAGEEVVE